MWVSQGNENAVRFAFRVFDGDRELDYGRFQAARALFAVNGRAVAWSDCGIEDDRVVCVLPEEALGRQGLVTGQLTLSFPPEGLLTTNYFSFNVLPGLAKLSEGERRVYINEIDELAKLLRDALEAAGEGGVELDAIMSRVRDKSAEIEGLLADMAGANQAAKDSAEEASAAAKAVSKCLDDAALDAKAVAGAFETAAAKLLALEAVLSQAEAAEAQITAMTAAVAVKKDESVAVMQGYVEGLEGELFVTRSELNDAVAAMGGSGGSGVVSPFQTFQFDMTHFQSNWLLLPDCPHGLANSSAVVIGDNIYVFGCGSGLNSMHTYIYDPRNNYWETGPSSPKPAINAGTAVWNGKVYVCGGSNNNLTIQIYDISADSWSESAPCDTAMKMAEVATVIWGGKIYITGGDAFQERARIYDIATDTWGQSSKAPTVMKQASQNTVIYKDKVYIFGIGVTNDETLIYDLAADTWAYGTQCPMQTNLRCAIMTDPGEIVIHSGGSYRQTLVYYTDTGKWRTIHPSPVANTRSRGVYFNKRLYYFGGATQPLSCVLAYERPPEAVRLLDCKAGDVVWANCALVTDSGQPLKRYAETVIQSDGHIHYRTCEAAGMVTLWRKRG